MISAISPDGALHLSLSFGSLFLVTKRLFMIVIFDAFVLLFVFLIDKLPHYRTPQLGHSQRSIESRYPYFLHWLFARYRSNKNAIISHTIPIVQSTVLRRWTSHSSSRPSWTSNRSSFSPHSPSSSGWRAVGASSCARGTVPIWGTVGGGVVGLSLDDDWHFTFERRKWT